MASQFKSNTQKPIKTVPTKVNGVLIPKEADRTIEISHEYKLRQLTVASTDIHLGGKRASKQYIGVGKLPDIFSGTQVAACGLEGTKPH